MTSQGSQARLERELFVLTEVAKTLTAHLDIPDLLHTVMDRIAHILDPAEFGMIFLWDPTEEVFKLQAAYGEGIQDPVVLSQIRLHKNESITGKVHASGKALFLSTPEAIAEAQADMSPENQARIVTGLAEVAPRSLIAAPLRIGNHQYGVLYLVSLRGPDLLSAADLPFVQTLADLIAQAIDRSRLEKEAADIRLTNQSDRMRAEALATLSHELRTPLAAIKGYATALMLDEIVWPIEKQREFLQLIDDECVNLETMINDVLDSSLIDAGQLALEIQPVRLDRLAQEVTDEMQRRSDIHRLVVEFPSDFPIVDADTRRLRQVLRNIVDNALKYSPEGGLVVIRGNVRPADVVISIADEGIGITPEDLVPLFEKYFRVKAPTGYHVPGTGLGLPVAREIVEAHGGRIWAESRVAEGTTLFFSIPRVGPSSEIYQS